MRERIKRLMEDRTNMLAAISHDLRTPITRMRLRAEFVEDTAIRADMLRDLERLNEMVQSALAFIRDSRVDGAATSFDLPSLLRTICDQFGEMGEDVSYLGSEQKVVTGRPDALHRAVTNLVENALKFGTKAMIELQDLPDGGLAIDILDDGPGIADADPEKLMRPFVRGDDARTQSPQSGFGLGLTIANSIIVAHGGQLTLRNRQPRGLMARLTLGSGCRPAVHAARSDA
jgi:signal transduction histidine kinase